MEDQTKMWVIGGGALLLIVLMLGGRGGRGKSDYAQATLESMRIASATNIAYANAGVENSRILASLASEKDRNRTSIQIAAGEQQTQRHEVNRRTQVEGYRIRTDASTFRSKLAHDNRVDRRWVQFEKWKLGKNLSYYRDRDKTMSATQRYAADRGFALETRQIGLAEDALSNQYVLDLMRQGTGVVTGLTDAWNSWSGNLRRGYGSVDGGYDYRAPQYLLRPGSGYPQGATGGTGGERGGASGDLATLGMTTATGCVAGPWGCLAGAVVGGVQALA